MVRPKNLLVWRISLEHDLVEHFDVLNVSVVHTEPGWVQLTKSQIGVEGDVISRVPVLAVEHLGGIFVVLCFFENDGGPIPGTRCPS